MAFAHKAALAALAAFAVGGCATVAAPEGDAAAPATAAAAVQPAPARAAALPDAAQQRIARYTSMTARPAPQAADPLDTWARITYPRQTVRTVGDAIDHTLMRTGWRLADAQAFDAQVQNLMALPLPESQRELGPYPVRTTLDVLTGKGWQWHEDPVRRLVWFSLEGAAVPAAGAATAGGTSTAPAPRPAIEAQPLAQLAPAKEQR